MMEENHITFLKNKYSQVMVLKIYIDNRDLKDLYKIHIEKHNNALLNETHINSGFDIFSPKNEKVMTNSLLKYDFEIKCSAKMYSSNNNVYNTGYYMYPRSSLSKTALRLANSVGIIDSGYRGNLIGMFDVINEYNIEVGSRLVQICSPTLGPVYVELEDKLEELDITTRGEGGFGSTGK